MLPAASARCRCSFRTGMITETAGHVVRSLWFWACGEGFISASRYCTYPGLRQRTYGFDRPRDETAVGASGGSRQPMDDSDPFERYFRPRQGGQAAAEDDAFDGISIDDTRAPRVDVSGGKHGGG